MDKWVFFIVCFFLFAMIFAAVEYAYPLPEIEKIVSGEVSVEIKDQNTMHIQASDRSIINYSSFDIMHNESVHVTLPSFDSSILNRVVENNPSELIGDLHCNGIFILVNESGIYVGPEANIDAGSLVFSTRDIDNADFLNGD